MNITELDSVVALLVRYGFRDARRDVFAIRVTTMNGPVIVHNREQAEDLIMKELFGLVTSSVTG